MAERVPGSRRHRGGITGPVLVLVGIAAYLTWKVVPLLAGPPVDRGLPSLVGSWTRNSRNGHETFTIRADGTATWINDGDAFAHRRGRPVEGRCTVDMSHVPHWVDFEFPELFDLVGVYELTPEGGLRIALASPDFSCFEGRPTQIAEDAVVLTRAGDAR